MQTIELQEVQQQLASLIQAAAEGEGFIIADHGKPLVTVEAVKPKTIPSRIGFLDGKYRMPDDFKGAFAKDMEEMFYGNDEASS